MTQPIFIIQEGGSGGGTSQAVLNFDYVALREAVRDWKGTRSLRKAAEAADIDHSSLYMFLKGRLIAWETVQKLCTAMRRDTGDFLR